MTSEWDWMELNPDDPRRASKILAYIEAGAGMGLGKVEWETIKACLRARSLMSDTGTAHEPEVGDSFPPETMRLAKEASERTAVPIPGNPLNDWKLGEDPQCRICNATPKHPERCFGRCVDYPRQKPWIERVTSDRSQGASRDASSPLDHPFRANCTCPSDDKINPNCQIGFPHPWHRSKRTLEQS